MDALIGSYSNFKVTIKSHTSNIYDVTDNVTKLTIFEAIDQFFLRGDMIMYDDSGLVNRVPLIGQETVQIEFTKDDIDRVLNFRITDVYSIEKVARNISSIRFKLVTEKEFLNSTKTFSRSFRGITSDIIKTIYKSYLNREVEIYDKGSSSYNIVFPFIKPYQAIDKILDKAFNNEKSPLFLFDTLNSGETTKLISFNTMISKDAKFTIYDSKELFNTGKDGSTVRGLADQRHHIKSIKQETAYDTLSILSKGAYASNTTVIDISNKTVSTTTFKYTDSAKIKNELISKEYKIDDKPLDELSNSRHFVSRTNNVSFEADGIMSNYNTINTTSLMSRSSFINRMNVARLNAVVDPIKEIECGDCLDVKIQQNIPALKNLPEDMVSSGKYLISAISHNFDKTTYSMSLELIRDFIGVEHAS